VRGIRQAYRWNESRAWGAGRDHAAVELLGKLPRSARRIAPAIAGVGGGEDALRIPALDRPVAEGRSEGERPTGVSDLSEEHLQVRTAKRTKLAPHLPVPPAGASRPHQRWSMDFVSERLWRGGWFRVLTVVDQYTRECWCAFAERSQTGEKVVEQMKRPAARRGAPESITTDNGSEFAGRAMKTWAYETGVKLDFIRPGKPPAAGRMSERPEQNWSVGARITMSSVRTARWTIGHRRSLPSSRGALLTVDKTEPDPGPGSAGAGPKRPALDRAPILPLSLTGGRSPSLNPQACLRG
jgi:transposase InsO family protein